MDEIYLRKCNKLPPMLIHFLLFIWKSRTDTEVIAKNFSSAAASVNQTQSIFLSSLCGIHIQNMCSIFQIACDGAIFNRCLDCFLGKARYISNLRENVVALQTGLETLIAAKQDVMTRVGIAERQQMIMLNQVQLWLSGVEAVKAEADKLIRDGSNEIDKLCLGGYCSRNCKSSYKLGKKVAKKLRDVKTLIDDGVFEEVAARAPEPVADERPVEPTTVGLQSKLEKVWRCLIEEPAGIIGLYGMGGVGKTTLLNQINNKFVDSPTDFDYVFWVVVSKDLRLEKIQEAIGKKIGLLNDSWKNGSLEEKAQVIFNFLRKKKFVLFLDDIWERIDLIKVGIPRNTTSSKVVFTTRSVEVCGLMEAKKKFKVDCLLEEQAWELFREKVGEETLNSDPDILQLAQAVAKECGGLPLALITIGRAMACKKTCEEWNYAITVLRRATAASKFAGLGKEVYPLLKFSYDNLPNDVIKSCFLYCCLYPEDYLIFKKELIECWICEGFLEEPDWLGAQRQGYDILGTLVRSCLLEELHDRVKMHDVVRDMALWISCEIEMAKENFFVHAGVGLTEAPDVTRWENVKRLSLMQNEIANLQDVPTCSHLHTLFLRYNEFETITDGFFKSMTSLRVLNMSDNFMLRYLPSGMSALVSLQLLDLSITSIKELPQELKALINLKCLNLNYAGGLIIIPRQLISNFSRLCLLRMNGTGRHVLHEASQDSILFGGGEVLMEELLGLKYLEILEISLGSMDALGICLSSPKLRSCIQVLSLQGVKDLKSLDVSALADLNHLNELFFWKCEELEEVKITNIRRQPYVFHSLHHVGVEGSYRLTDLTFLIFAPNLKTLAVRDCASMEEIISIGKFPEMIGNPNPFPKLRSTSLENLPNLKSIYRKPLPFTHLKRMFVRDCDELRKLPLDSNSAKECNIEIYGNEKWWQELQWEDQATQNAFLPCFKTVDQLGK